MERWTKVQTPEEVGISSRGLLNYLDAVAAAPQVEHHAIMVLRHGKLAAAMNFAPYDNETPHMLFSLSKSFCSAAAGFAVQEGLLQWDSKVVEVLDEYAPENPSEWLKSVTLHHLLCMGSGLKEESDGVAGKGVQEWAKAVLAHDCVREPGTYFHYNSHGTYLVSCMVQRVTGMTVRDYLLPRLFEPLGIKPPRWDMSPQGVCCGGWGMYLSCEDMAKFGVCLLQNGMWNGKQVIPAEWIALASKPHIATNTVPRHREWSEGYGYHLWACTNGRFRGDGSEGQFCIISPRQNMIVAATACTENLTGEHDLFDEYLFRDARQTPGTPQEQTRFADRLKTLAIHKE